MRIHTFSLVAILAVSVHPSAGQEVKFLRGMEHKVVVEIDKVGLVDNPVVYALAFSPDGKTLVGGGHGIQVWNPQDGKRQARLHMERFNNLRIMALAFASSGTDLFLLGASDDGIDKGFHGPPIRQDFTTYLSRIDFPPKLSDIIGKKILEKEKVKPIRNAACNRGLAVAPSGKVFAFKGDAYNGRTPNGVYVHDVIKPDAEPLQGFQGNSEPIDTVDALAFSADSEVLAIARGKVIQLCSLKQNKIYDALLGHTDRVTDLKFLNNRLLASGSVDRSIRLWDIQTGQELAVLKAHRAEISSLSASADGKLLAAGSWDGTVTLWDVPSRAALAKIRNDMDKDRDDTPVLAVALSPDGKLLASLHRGSGEKFVPVRLWDLKNLRPDKK